MSSQPEELPVMQRLFDNIWLLAVLALAFFIVTYLIWGLVDIFSIPPGVII